MTAVIIDDEPNSASYLQGLLEKQIPEIILKGRAGSVEEGIALIQKTKPSIVFLDVELQTATGFDLLNRLGAITFSVIFTTAHEHYALQAIKFAALDFLLKPVDADELKSAVNKASKHHNESFLNENLSVLLENMRNKKEQKKIAISTSSGIHVIELKDILYLQADGPYTNIYSNNTLRIMSSKHLKEYEDLLRDFGFYRIHKSYVVNLTEIKQYVKSDGGYVIMSNGVKVAVSEKKKDDLITKLSSQVIFVR